MKESTKDKNRIKRFWITSSVIACLEIFLLYKTWYIPAGILFIFWVWIRLYRDVSYDN